MHPEHCLLYWGPRCCWRVGCCMLCSDAGFCLSSALDGAHVQCPPFLYSHTWISEGRARVSCGLQNLPWIVRVQSRISTSYCFLARMNVKLFFITWELLPPNNREWKKAKWFAKLLQKNHRCLYSDLLWVQNYLGVKFKELDVQNYVIKSHHALHRQLLPLEMSVFLGTESCVRRSLCLHKS